MDLPACRPYGETWIDSCLQQTLLPNAPWHKLEKHLSAELANHVHQQFSHPIRREVILSLLGDAFIQEHFPDEKPNPQLLEPPSVSDEDYRRLRSEAQTWLQTRLYRIAKDLGYQALVTGASTAGSVQNEVAEFFQHTFSTFSASLDRRLYHHEQEKIRENKLNDLEHQEFIKVLRVPAPSVVRDNTLASSATVMSDNNKPSTAIIKETIHSVVGDPPPLWGTQSEEVSKAVVTLLRSDPRKFSHVTGRLHGRQLAGSLRTYLWADVLFKAERKLNTHGNIEKLIRERFARSVQRGTAELEIKRATQSPISGLIENAVIETYSRTVSMVPYKNDETHVRDCIRVLNVLYVHDHSYEPYLIHWLFPIQLAFQELNSQGERVYELAMYLDLFKAGNFPAWPQVFAIAERVMELLQQGDQELHDHLKQISSINSNINTKEFLVQLIHIEKTKAEALVAKTTTAAAASSSSSSKSKKVQNAKMTDPDVKLLADPLIFLRKWIGECFVGVLDSPAVMYIWDQCFMQIWTDSVLQNFCLVLLELLKYKFMDAQDYVSMKQVFLTEPCKLYTMDIQQAWIHIENNGPLSAMPALNRQRPLTPVSARRTPSLATPSRPLLPCIVHDIRMKLVFPTHVFNTHEWIKNEEFNKIAICVGIYYGATKLDTRFSKHNAVKTHVTTDAYGNQAVVLSFIEDRFKFKDLNLSLYDVERELGSSLHAVVEVLHKTEETKTERSTVGWCRMPLYKQLSHGQWTLMTGNQTCPINPGTLPDSLMVMEEDAPGPSFTSKSHILEGSSELFATVSDPSNMPAIPEADPFLSGEDLLPQLPPQDTQLPKEKDSDVITPPEPKQKSPDPPPIDKSPWVPYNRQVAAKFKPAGQLAGTDQAFDIYIDSVRFIPDNATIIKVTGGLLHANDTSDAPEITAFPLLTSAARSPQFTFRKTFESESFDSRAQLFLRLYTVDIVTEQLVVIGNCIVNVFTTDSDGQTHLHMGGQQVKLFNGLPNLTDDADTNMADLHKYPAIPACTILIRLLPHSDSHIASPHYGTGYYESSECQPIRSEERIFNSYADHMAYPGNVTEMAKRLQALQGSGSVIDDFEIEAWIEKRLDKDVQLAANQPALHMNLQHCVRYRLKVGLMVHIDQVFGLQDGVYVQCLARIQPGSTATDMEMTDDGFGRDETVITLKHDYDSFQHAPKWSLDPAKEIHPYYDQFSCLLVRLYGLRVLYKPRADHSAPGTVLAAGGKRLTLGDQSVLGWTVVPLFHGNAVLSGQHHVPVLRGNPTPEIIKRITQNTLETVLSSKAGKPKPIEGASLFVTLLDAHFDLDEYPQMPVYENLLQYGGRPDNYRKARENRKGKLISDFVLDNLDKKSRKQGITSDIYTTEKVFFEEVMMQTYQQLIDNEI